MDMQLVAYLHPTLPWNNLEELSSLWAVFTKCKRQLRNGFRLENMTWRLWYRQAVMQKQNAPPPTIISPSHGQEEHIPVRSLSRSQSLPDLRVPRISKPAEPKPLRYEQPSTPTKFFIDDYDDDSSMEDDDEWYDNSTSSSTMYSSTVSSVTSFQDDLFSKQQVQCCAKPTSLLSSMLLQQEEQQQQQQQQQTQEKAPMLRRCKGFSQQLDSWFSKAA